MNIFIGNLARETTSQQLEDKFSTFGKVDACRIIKDQQSGASKGFGFVEMSDTTNASHAIHELNNTELDGRKLTINEARPKNSSGSYSGSNRRY